MYCAYPMLLPWGALSWRQQDTATVTDLGKARRAADYELVIKAGRGDNHARAELVRRLLPRVRRIARALASTPHDADDAAQSALLAILEAAPRFRGEANLENWAKRIAVRIVLRHGHQQKRYQGGADDDQDEAASLVAVPAPAPASEALPRSLREYLQELPPPQREALVLRHALEHSIDEIAELTGVGRDTVRGRLRLGVQAIRKLVRREISIGAKGRRRAET